MKPPHFNGLRVKGGWYDLARSTSRVWSTVKKKTLQKIVSFKSKDDVIARDFID